MPTPKILALVNDPSQYDDSDNAFQDIDYIRSLTDRLEVEVVKDKGVVVAKVFYTRASVEPTGLITYQDPIVRETYTYTRDSDGFAIFRDALIEWYNDDETISPATKVRHKTYSPVERIKETERRRRNVMDDLKITLIGMVAATDQVPVASAIAAGRALFTEYQDTITNYIETGSDTLASNITSDASHSWLDNVIAPPSTTIRMYILSQL